MKRILCLFYRLAFIIFGIWAFAESCDYASEAFLPLLSNTAFWVDAVLIAVIFIGFAILLHRMPPDWYYVLKCGVTLLAVWLLIVNWHDFLQLGSANWMIRILLPFTAVLDWLLFDKKGGLNWLDLLLCLLGAFLALGLLNLLLGNLGFDLASVPGWLDLLLNLLLPLLALLLLDKLLSSGLKNPASKVCLLYRIFFLLAEMWAFYKLSGGVPLTLLLGFKYFSVLVNALAFLCIAVLLIQLLVKREGGKTAFAFLRLKGLIMLSMTVVLLYNVLFVRVQQDVHSVTFVHGILCPALFILDWLLFDKKGAFKVFDPFLWLILPAVYYVATGLILKSVYGVNLYPALYNLQPLLVIGGGVVLLLSAGYIYCLLDMIFKRK